MFRKTILPNKLRIITAPMRGTNTVTILVLCATGSDNEPRGKGGISHFLEHMFFKGTRKRPTPQAIMQETVSMGATYPRPVQVFGEACRLDSSLAFNFAYNGSNQNTYDASRTQFVGDSYSYYSAGGGPTFRMAWGDKKRPAMASLSMRYHHVAYLGRQAQDGDGIYSGSQQWQDRYLLGLNYAYPIARGFYLKGQTNLLWERSNQNYEKTYAYNYQTANYIMGFTYEY